MDYAWTREAGTNHRPLRVLIVEDSEEDCLLLVYELRRGGFLPEFERVETADAMREALARHPWDLVVSDYSLPTFSAPEALEVLQESGTDAPCIVVSGVVGEEAATGAMHAGAQDYLTKGRLERLAAAVERELTEAETRRQRRNAEEEVQRRNRELSALNTIAAAVSRSLHLETVLRSALDEILKVLGAEGGIIRLSERYGTASETCQGFSDPAVRELVELPEGAPEASRLLAEGWRSVVRLPLKIQERTVGLIVVGKRSAEGFPPEIQRMLQGIGLQVCAALENARLYEETRRLRVFSERIVEGVADAIVMEDAAGRLTFANPAAERLLGYSRQELQGLPWSSLLPERLRSPEAMSRSREAASRSELWVRHRDGHEIAVIVASRPLADDGRFAGYLTAFTDITERKKAEEALLEAEKRLAAIIDFLPDATFAVDCGSRVIAWNRAMEEATGVLAADMLGKGDYEYALPFYGTRRPLLIDLVRRPDPDTERCYHPIIRRERDMLIAETHVPSLLGKRAFIWGKASLLYDSKGAVAGAIEVIRDITDRHEEREALQASEERYRFFLEASFEGTAIVDNGVLLDVSPQFFRMLGYAPEEVIGRRSVELVAPEDRDAVAARIASRDERTYEARLLRKDGSLMPAEIRARHFTYRGREVSATGLRDISDRKQNEEAVARLQEQLLQSQKMEAIGRLAGGIAHDFNNLLTTILGHVELLKTDGGVQGLAIESVDEIEKAGRRAAGLTNQLLAFSRKQMLQPRPTNLNALVENLSKMLRRLIGEDVALELELAADLGFVRADPGQMEQVIVNLAVNARDAMPQGGTLTIRTQEASEESARYVRLSITDTGTGMDEEVMSHLFEPFYTTKERGKGTGLGLSTVYGIVEQSEGHIRVDSEPGRGTTFTIDLPRLPPEAELEKPPSEAERPRGGNEAILLVEDEEAPFLLMGKVLRNLGYKVTGSRSPREALELMDREGGVAADLLITDVVLPGMNGTDLAKELRRRIPGLKVLFISGYMESSVFRNGVLAESGAFLQKPFSLSELGRKVRGVLGYQP